MKEPEIETNFDLLVHMMDKHAEQLEKIRDKLVEIEHRLIKIEEDDKGREQMLNRFMQIASSWAFWLIIIALFVSIDTHHLVLFLENMLGIAQNTAIH